MRSSLIIGSISSLIRVTWSRNWGLGWRTLHSWRWRWPSWSRPHARAHSTRLSKRRAHSSLIFIELWQRTGIIVVGRGCVYRWTAMLRGRSGRWMIHIRWHLRNNMSRRRVDGWWSTCHWWRRSLAINQVRSCCCLGRMLHWMTNRWRWRWWWCIMLLWRHNVMGQSYHWLTRIFRMMMRRNRTVWKWFTGVRTGIILNRDSYQIAVFSYPVKVLTNRARWWWSHGHLGRGWPNILLLRIIMLMWHMLYWRRWHQNRWLWWNVVHVMLFWRHYEAIRNFRGSWNYWRMNWLRWRTARWFSCSHVTVIDVGLQVPLRQVCSLASLNNATHEEGPSCTLLNSLDRVIAALDLLCPFPPKPFSDSRANLVPLFFLLDCTIVAEDMFAWYHTPINFDRQPTLITEMHRCVIFFSNQIYLIIPKKVSRKSSLIHKHVTRLAIIPFLFTVIKSFFVTRLRLCSHSGHTPWRTDQNFAFVIVVSTCGGANCSLFGN